MFFRDVRKLTVEMETAFLLHLLHANLYALNITFFTELVTELVFMNLNYLIF